MPTRAKKGLWFQCRLPLLLPTSYSLPTTFLVEQGLMLTKHLRYPLPPKDHQTALQEPHSFCCQRYDPSIHMQVFSLSTTWERKSVFGILIL